MILSIWNYFRGYVIIEVSGFSIERFMNLAVNKNIFLWDIDYKIDKIEMKVSIKGYKNLKYCAKKTKCKIKIVKKIGLPFFTYTFRKRKILMAGFLFFGVLLFFLSGSIWAIEVSGNSQVNTYEIIDFVKKNDISLGTRKNNINTILLEEKILKNFDKISWVNIQSVGTTLYIKTSEILEEKNVETEKEASNIVANRDGLIESIYVNKGLAKVKTSDVVKKGDILITGEIFLSEDENGKHYRYTNAEGNIRSKFYYDMNFFVPFNYSEYEYTKNTKNFYSIYWGEDKINLYFNRNFYENYDIMFENRQLNFGEKYKTPIVLKKEIQKEKKIVEKIRNAEECKIYANKIINEKLTTEFDTTVDIVDKKIEYIAKNDGIEIKLELATIENIGIEEKINIGDVNAN